MFCYMARQQRRPIELNQLAKFIVDVATGDKKLEEDKEESYAVKYGRKGGLKEGKARAESLSPEKRKRIPEIAAKKRWKK